MLSSPCLFRHFTENGVMFAFLQDDALQKADLLHELYLSFNPLYTGGVFHCYMSDESIFHLKGVGSILSLLFCF